MFISNWLPWQLRSTCSAPVFVLFLHASQYEDSVFNFNPRQLRNHQIILLYPPFQFLSSQFASTKIFLPSTSISCLLGILLTI